MDILKAARTASKQVARSEAKAQVTARSVTSGAVESFQTGSKPDEHTEQQRKLAQMVTAHASARRSRDVIVIGSPGTHTPNNKNFELAARTLHQTLAPGAEIVYPYGEGLRGEEAEKRVREALTKGGEIDHLYYLGHGSESGLWVAPGAGMGADDFANVKFREGVFYGCNLGDAGGFAEKLAAQNHAKTRAIQGTMQFSGTRDGWANYGFSDAQGRSIDSNKTPLTGAYPGQVWGVPAHPWTGDTWVDY